MQIPGCTALIAILTLSSVAFCQDGVPSESAALPDPSEDSFQWRPALTQSFLSLVIEHTERAASQSDTRDAIHGPFFAKYAESMENLHGWNDGDGFFTSYVLHPWEGSFAGFVQRQNDPKYRDVEFGSSRRYWISCMRSLAFSTAYSIVWSGTPLGEAGIGNVELHNKPGLVDLVGTQAMGFGWMVMEDALDRYVITRIEQRVQNPWVRFFARSVLNPTRGYANVLAFHKPQHRYTRPGVWVKQTVVASTSDVGPKFSAAAWPERTAFELMVQPIAQRYLGRHGSTCIGGAGEGLLKLGVIDLNFHIDGCKLYGLEQNVSGDALNYLVGPRLRFPFGRRWTPFMEVLAGGTKITHATSYPVKEKELEQEAKKNDQPPPEYASYHSEVDTNGFTVLATAGVSYRINDAFSWRVGSLSYQRSWMLDRLNGFDYDQGLRLSMGIALTMGPWRR